MTNKIACIEAGGTKFVCAIGNSDGSIDERISIPTTNPTDTMNAVKNYFDKHIGEFTKMSIGTFGPVQVNKRLKDYGMFMNTPKVGWPHYNMLDFVKEHYSDVEFYFDTDVNAACLGEYLWGNGKDVNSCIYMTVGTGFGVGAVFDGKIHQGISHPEMGHIKIRRHPQDIYEGSCPYHKDCVEGLASGFAMEKRWGKKGIELPIDHLAWEIEAYYIAQALVNYILILSPERIILGGGVMKQRQLFPKIRKQVQELLNGYLPFNELESGIDNYIVPPKLEDNAGIVGTIAVTLNNI